jgi:uncharacterized protein YjbI with pentapeptide repeats
MKVALLHRVLEISRKPHFHVGAMLGFPLTSSRAMFDEMAFWDGIRNALGATGIVDEGFAKARGELLVAGSFHAPGGVPIGASYVRVRLGQLDKRLAVLGDREWRDNVATSPIPMTTMPVDWGHAFGGAKFERNVYGKGAAPVERDGTLYHPLPNIEPYGALLRSPAERPDPAGLLSMDMTFAQRRKRAGTHDQRWFEEHFPGVAADADPTFLNLAPPDQWVDGCFTGDEEFSIENMHPTWPRIDGRLPGLLTRVFVTHRTREGEAFVEIPMRWDTAWLFPEIGMGVVIAHGTRPVADDDAADIVHLVAACEEPGAPRGVEHYQHALLRRLDKDKGAVAELSDSDLMPARSSGVVPNVTGLDIGQWVKSDGVARERGRRGHARKLKEAAAMVAEEGLDPKDYQFDKMPEEPEIPSPDDPDALAAFVEAQFAKSDADRRLMDEKLEQSKAQAREIYAESGMDYDAVMAEGTKDGPGPPKFTAAGHLQLLRETVGEAREAGYPMLAMEEQLADPDYPAQLLEQERGLREMYRSSAHLLPKAATQDAESSERIRLLIKMTLEAGESLANRDFTGANLAGMSLAGVDLSGALLEGADLSRCDLSRADLSNAVLSKANLEGANLANAALNGANLGGANLERASLDHVDMKGGILSRATLRGATFENANLTGVDWFETKLAGVDLSGAELGQSTFLNADLTDARLVGTDLSEATFVDSCLDGADLSRARMHKTSFIRSKGERVRFREAHFRQGVMVHGSAFPQADFQDANLEDANFRGTVLIGARFDRSEMSGCDLSDCDATGATFERCVINKGMLVRTDLTGASLKGANLMDALASKSKLVRANFTGANLVRADLSRVVGDAETSFADAQTDHVRYFPKANLPTGSAT